jgi:hypothetical protein
MNRKTESVFAVYERGKEPMKYTMDGAGQETVKAMRRILPRFTKIVLLGHNLKDKEGESRFARLSLNTYR